MKKKHLAHINVTMKLSSDAKNIWLKIIELENKLDAENSDEL